ncbi:MAG: DNA polymerase III subunit alpha [Austwickia sp.]|nr:DNA polymerase III subunit alpha [Austwickia sp.]
MPASFVHLHVASGYSMRYGASTPRALVERAVELGQPALALTDRDGLYGAIRFVQACTEQGIAPVLGVDLALEPGAGERSRRSRTPARGGMLVDPRHPRVTVLARGQGSGLAPGVGWGRLCRLVTATHLRGERGSPVTTAALIAEHARLGERGDRSGSAFLVLLGPDSDVGRAVLARRMEQAQALLARWFGLLPPGGLAVEIVCHQAPPDQLGSAAHASRMLALATQTGVPTVLTAAVRHATPQGAATVDVLDAARRLVPLDTRHLDRITTGGHLASAARMMTLATEVTGNATTGRYLLDRTVDLARECVLDPRTDLGIGGVHLPETAALGLSSDQDPQAVLAARCAGAIADRYAGAGESELRRVRQRLDEELRVIAHLGYPTYFLTVAVVVDVIRDAGVRVAARGSGAGCLVNYLLGISGVEPLRYGLLMERFCTPLRAQLPDIDIDVESARRTQMYELILDRFGGDRVTCVSMMDTYRVRHAVRDAGAALGLPPTEIDAIAKAFPHIAARNAREAIAELPELRAYGLDSPRLTVLFDLVEALDGLPRHIALHPCGVILSNSGLLDRTPVEASWLGFPMSQFDKDDVEALGLLKLDVLGIRMQSAMAHASAEVARVTGIEIDLDDPAQVPLDDAATFELIRSTRTLGMFQIESPGQRELVGKFGPQTFEDLIIDISLFRPGPVKSDMITPFLRARQGWEEPEYLHPSLIEALRETCGVVVFHEQVLHIIAVTTGVGLAEADEVRRAMGSFQGQEEVQAWWRPRAAARGYSRADRDRIWEVLRAFASFGFCKAHAAAFALPTFQSAWLKTHHPAAFLAGVLTHDPGMYPKRLILDDARHFGVTVLGLDVNASTEVFTVEPVDPVERPGPGERGRPGDGWGIRMALTEVKGISDAQVAAIVAGQPYAGLEDFWQRTGVDRPVVERIILAGGFDRIYGLDVNVADGLGRYGRITRRDLLLTVTELERWTRAIWSGSGSRPRRPAQQARLASTPATGLDVRAAAAAQSQAAATVTPADRRPTQLLLDLGDAPMLTAGAGLPEMTRVERVHAELDILGLDVTDHVLAPYAELLAAMGTTRAADLRDRRSRSEVLVAGVKVATQTPPIRSGRRVVFLTLDDSTGPVDATFFEDVQGPYAATVFHSWLLLVRGIVRRTGPRGVSLRATGAWELSRVWESWLAGGIDRVRAALAASESQAWEGSQRSSAHRMAHLHTQYGVPAMVGDGSSSASGHSQNDRSGGMGGGGYRRVLVHPSGFRQSPYADVRPAGSDTRDGRGLAHLAEPGEPAGAGLVPGVGDGPSPQGPAGAPPRKLWHASPGSSGR